MKKRVLIIHGWESNSTEHWFLEEKERLEKMGYEVLVPDMPNTSHPKREEWVKTIEDFNPDENSILIGHSLGGPAILSFLQKANQKVDVCIMIAAPIWKLGYSETDDFFENYDWKKIKKMANKFVILNQKDDPWVKPEHGKTLADKLGGELNLIEGNDHFNEIEFNLIEKNL